MKKLLLISAGLISLSACNSLVGTSDKEARFVHYGQVGGAQSVGMHTVAAGDTVYNIAQRYNLALQDVINANNLQAPYQLKRGTRLRLTSPQSYKVKAGDTVESVARMFNASASQLAKMNQMRAPYALAAGQVLRLPPSIKPLAPLYTSEMLAARRAAQQKKIAAAGRAATSAGKMPAVRDDDMMPIESAPVQGGIEREVLAAPAPVTVEPLGAPPMPNVVAQPTITSEAVAEAPSQKAVNVASTTVPPRAGSKFIWPVDGPIISTYGKKADGRSNDGVNISAAKGTKVVAAENGVVAYAGDELAGYGNLVLIRHADKWMTAYGHLDGMVVTKGATVTRGQAIGTVGQTGSVDRPQLHFEVRRGTEALNPEPYLMRQGS
ncbi:MAG TPA: LysM peptidoglycan-binding domain-containing M23 family metallopeptidase [Micavibrio sp.]